MKSARTRVAERVRGGNAHVVDLPGLQAADRVEGPQSPSAARRSSSASLAGRALTPRPGTLPRSVGSG